MRPESCGGGLLFLAALLNFFPVNTDWFGIKDITLSFLYVLLGMYFSEPLVSKGKRALPIGAGVICFAMGTTMVFFMPETKVTILVSFFLLMNSTISFAMWLADKHFYWLGALEYFGERAFTVYIYSWPIQAMLELLVVVVLKWTWPICFAVLFISGMCCPVLIYEIYERAIPHNKVFDYLIGVK